QGSLPCWRVGVFEIGHVDVCTGIEGIDHHLPVDWTCDFDAPLAEVGWDRSDFPVGVSNFARLVEEIGKCYGAQALMDEEDRKSTRLNSSHVSISYAVFCLKKK